MRVWFCPREEVVHWGTKHCKLMIRKNILTTEVVLSRIASVIRSLMLKTVREDLSVIPTSQVINFKFMGFTAGDSNLIDLGEDLFIFELLIVFL